MTDSTERRRFKRFAFDASARIQQGDQSWTEQVNDISLKGLLTKKPAEWTGQQDGPFHIVISLDAETKVEMDADLVRVEADQLGFACHKIDLDSISHLRRLIELNLGDQSLLERELSALGKD
ncbi:PilZ domain-containing protein [Pseudomonas asuensis]|jgi:hypothetical protein|uniref:Cyclic diguanosine monophosphate-binding protein n=1 Tax=Pseudomonas asuensis TaxID=1825787 RepID=A0ABQ2GIC3_9PSED|nr:PilZ domain-containing protein [Pseudomonas asuensis]GGL96876.1 cyclic diguanosine monophosphate-binding protein [Pseudomonas asuensis]